MARVSLQLILRRLFKSIDRSLEWNLNPLFSVLVSAFLFGSPLLNLTFVSEGTRCSLTFGFLGVL